MEIAEFKAKNFRLWQAPGFGRQILGTEPKGHELKSVPSMAGIKFLFSYALGDRFSGQNLKVMSLNQSRPWRG